MTKGRVIEGIVHRVGGPLFMVREDGFVARLYNVGELVTGFDERKRVRITVEIDPMEEKPTGKRIDATDTVSFLNELVALDSAAMHQLVDHRVPCNEALANHPTVQVRGVGDAWDVGILGIINGLFGIDDAGWGFIAAAFDDSPPGQLLRFLTRSAKTASDTKEIKGPATFEGLQKLAELGQIVLDTTEHTGACHLCGRSNDSDTSHDDCPVGQYLKERG